MTSLESRLALHSWTLDSTPLPEFLAVARSAGYSAVELRHTDFERRIEMGERNEQVLAMVRESGLKVVTLGLEPGLLYARGEEQRRLRESLEQSCAYAVALGCDTLVITPGQNSPDKTLDEAAASLRKAAEIAASEGLRLAFEFYAPHPIVNSLAMTCELLSLADHPGCGILLDTFHLASSGFKWSELADVPDALIWDVQFSDVPKGSAHTGQPSLLQRLAPGRGGIPWAEMLKVLASKNYQGYLSYEAPNAEHWARPPLEVARGGFDILRFAEVTA